jgi:protein-S-isoprenylcysteine O-methyltransferase Ste14
MLLEERLVAAEYPEYAAYARQTRRVIPFVL